MQILLTLFELYYCVVIITALLMLGAYVANQHANMKLVSIDEDQSGVIRFVRSWGVKLFIPLYLFNALAYVIPSLFLNFSFINLSFLIIPLLLRRRILYAWKEREPLYDFLDKIGGGIWWVSFLQVFVVVGMFMRCLWDTANYYSLF